MFNVSPFSSSFPPQAPKEYSSLLRKGSQSPVNTNSERIHSDSFELKFGMDSNNSSLKTFVQFYEEAKKKSPLSSSRGIINHYVDQGLESGLPADTARTYLSRYLHDPEFRKSNGLEDIYNENHPSNPNTSTGITDNNRDSKIGLQHFFSFYENQKKQNSKLTPTEIARNYIKNIKNEENSDIAPLSESSYRRYIFKYENNAKFRTDHGLTDIYNAAHPSDTNK